MPIQAVQIIIDRSERSIIPGAKCGQDLIDLAGVTGSEQVLLEVAGDVDIPLSPDDVLFIRGGEVFSIGDGSPVVEDNPATRKPVSVMFNDQPLPAHCNVHRAKLTGTELKELTGALDTNLWVDLDGLADERVEDTTRLILQPQDRFFTTPRDHEDRSYEVSVLLDGEDRQLSFPSGLTVLEALRRSLPPRDRAQVSDFDIVDGTLGTASLDLNLTLKAAGVQDGHVLSITKKNGGGG